MSEAERQVGYIESWEGSHYYGLQFAEQPEIDALIRRTMYGRVLEIGSGGGRFTKTLASVAKSVIAVDGTKASEELTKKWGRDADNVSWIVCRDGNLGGWVLTNVDCVFSFDTFVHFHPQLFLNYIRSVNQLKPDVFVLHYAKHFPGETEYNSQCFKYWDREDVVEAVGMKVLETMEFRAGFGSELIVFKGDNT